MPKYDDFQLDLQTQKFNEMNSMIPTSATCISYYCLNRIKLTEDEECDASLNVMCNL